MLVNTKYRLLPQLSKNRIFVGRKIRTVDKSAPTIHNISDLMIEASNLYFGHLILYVLMNQGITA